MGEAKNGPLRIIFDLKARAYKDMVSIFRIEQQRRASQLKDPDDQWMFDTPLINELCLMLLVGLSHEVERELVDCAALADNDGKEMDDCKYRKNVEQLRNRRGSGWKTIKTRLTLGDRKGYECIKVLRELANSYKHDQSMEPGENLLKSLQAESGPPSYASLPESDDLRKELATFIHLQEGADYCEIAEGFVEIVGTFLKDVHEQANLSTRKRDPGSFDPREMSR